MLPHRPDGGFDAHTVLLDAQAYTFSLADELDAELVMRRFLRCGFLSCTLSRASQGTCFLRLCCGMGTRIHLVLRRGAATSLHVSLIAPLVALQPMVMAMDVPCCLSLVAQPVLHVFGGQAAFGS